eukprot:Skav231182  [mRNA]  locus=scaffold425:49927:50127:- [translate_table: standard]
MVNTRPETVAQHAMVELKEAIHKATTILKHRSVTAEVSSALVTCKLEAHSHTDLPSEASKADKLSL